MPRRSQPHWATASRACGRPPPGRPVSDQRGRLLVAALGFAGLPRPSYDRALWALRFWLDSWSGIGRIAVGMARQGYDLQLTRYDERGWRATFYTTGMEHLPTSATGTGWERTPWHATQRAAWEALKKATEKAGSLLSTPQRIVEGGCVRPGPSGGMRPTRKPTKQDAERIAARVIVSCTSWDGPGAHCAGC